MMDFREICENINKQLGEVQFYIQQLEDAINDLDPDEWDSMESRADGAEYELEEANEESSNLQDQLNEAQDRIHELESQVDELQDEA
jgi:chromosome segregation ATPase